MSAMNIEQARFNMIEQQIRPWDVLDDRVLQVLSDTPREEFVPERYRALAFDEIVGIRDIVVKGLDSIVGEPAGVSGSTILGDGRVIMILDPTALATIPPWNASET